MKTVLVKVSIVQRGFTLIELIIVIVLLGILASVAVPRFMDITGSAHDANVSGTAGALGSAMSIAHAKWLASGQPTTLPPIKGLDLTRSGHADTGFSFLGWPNAATDGSANLIQKDILEQGGDDAKICSLIARNLLSSTTEVFGQGKECVQLYCAEYQKPHCVYTYQQDRSVPRNIVYDTSTGQVRKGIQPSP